MSTKHFSELDLQVLDERPWLEPFIEDNDLSIDAAIRRFDAAEREAKQQLRTQGVSAHRRARTTTGLQTTAIAMRPQDETS